MDYDTLTEEGIAPFNSFFRNLCPNCEGEGGGQAEMRRRLADFQQISPVRGVRPSVPRRRRLAHSFFPSVAE